jgi:hypothetical protein
MNNRDEIKNRYEDAITSCQFCGTKNRLHQVAFRKDNYVTGYLFACDDCHEKYCTGGHGVNIVKLDEVQQ